MTDESLKEIFFVPGSPQEAAHAFALVEPEMAALDANSLVAINVDIPRAVATALGARPALLRFRPLILDEFRRFPLASLDRLDTYALAAWYAHLLSLPAAPPDNSHKALVEEASALRSNLLVAAEALAHAGLFDAGHVAKIRSGQGHLDTANDLVALAALFRNNWGKIEGKTAITPGDIEKAATVGPRLIEAVGVREQVSERSPSQIADDRRRAFTLLVRAYDDCRRAVSYLRWAEGDTNQFAPSLYGRRPKAKAASPSSVDSNAQPTSDLPPASTEPLSEPGCES